MSTFSIGTTPQAVAQGFQREVTLYNQGPDTVYVDNNTSVTAISGYVIRPGDSMVWQADQPLYAVCRALVQEGFSGPWPDTLSGQARLQISDSGNILIPEAARNITLSSWGETVASSIRRNDMNVSAYRSLSIATTNHGLDVDGLERVSHVVRWHNESGAFLGGDTYEGYLSVQNLLTIPVTGTYASVTTSVVKSTGAQDIIPATSIIGHSNELPVTWMVDPLADDNSSLTTATDEGGRSDYVYFSGLALPPNSSSRFLISSKTRRVKFRLVFSGSVAASTAWSFVSAATNFDTGFDEIFDVVNKTTAGVSLVGTLDIPWQTTPILRISGTVPEAVTISSLTVTYTN